MLIPLLVLPLTLMLPRRGAAAQSLPPRQLTQASWQSYVLAPASRDVRPMAVLGTSQTGVTGSGGLLGSGTTPTRLTIAASDGTFRPWPSGTTASASSVQGPGNGRTYNASNAIDGSSSTFWNDDTGGNGTTDWLLITTPSAVQANGVTIVSSIDGVIQDFTVEISSSGTTFTTVATVQANSKLAPYVTFAGNTTQSFTRLRITVTKSADAGFAIFTRIAEVVLGEWKGDDRWPSGTTTTASSFHGPGDEPSYAPEMAIDGNVNTFWNDDTEGVGPDALTIRAGDDVVLPGVTLVSNTDGVPVDFTVELSRNGSTYTLAATVTNNAQTTVAVPFTTPATARYVRLTITRVQDNGRGRFSRVAELLPGLRPALPKPYVDIDFGYVVAGHLTLTFTNASNPPPLVRLAFSETRRYLGFRSDYSPSDYSGGRGTDDVVPPVNGGTWRDVKSCVDGVCADGLRGFRYVRLFIEPRAGSSSGWVELAPHGVKLDFTPYLGTPDTYTGHFECSDTLLNRIWYAASYTVEVGTDTFTRDTVDPRNAFSSTLDGKRVQHDAPKRDRDPYIGDIAVSSLVDLISHADIEGARNVILDLALHQRADGWIPPASIANYGLTLFDYPAWWAIAAGDLVLWRADTTFAQTIWAPLKKLMDQWYPSVSNSAGLLDKAGSYSGYGDYAFLPRSGLVTYYSANYIRALRSAALIATFLNHPTEATSWATRANTVSTALANSTLFDESVGAWRDSTTGGTSACHPQDATAFAILSGASSASRSQRSLQYLNTATRRTWGNSFVDSDCFGGGTRDRVYLFMSHPEVMARFETNDDSGALELIRRGWGWQIDRDPGGTFWEGVGADGDVANYQGTFASMAHGWSAGAAVALTTRLLGVQPTTPGFATYNVAPHPGDVRWANGTVPTPRGPITVSWYYNSANVLQTQVHGPTGTTANVRVPNAAANSTSKRSATPTVTLDGRTVWPVEAHTKREALPLASADDEGYIWVRGLVGGRRHVLQIA